MDLAQAYDPIRALQSASRVVARSPLPLVVGATILLFASGSLLDLISITEHRHWRRDAVEVAVSGLCCCSFIGFFVSSWIRIGFTHVVRETIEDGRTRVETVFDGKNRFVDMVIANVLVLLIVLAFAVAYAMFWVAASYAVNKLHAPARIIHPMLLVTSLSIFVAALYVILGLSVYRCALVIEQLSPTASLRRSWQLTQGHRLRLFLYWLVLITFSLLGFCLCCVGVIATSTIAQTAEIESYCALIRPDEYARSWLVTRATSTSSA